MLDVAIGLTFMFLLISLLVTTIQEWLAGMLKWRAANLFDALTNLLNTPASNDLVVDLYRHPIIQSLYRRPTSAPTATSEFRAHAKGLLPSYIPSRSFAIALLDVLRSRTQASEAVGLDTLLGDAHKVVAKLPPSDLKRTLTLLVTDLDSASTSLNERAALASERLEGWFNNAMSRSAGWYKRQAQFVSFVIGLGAAVTLNADAIHVARALWEDSALRASATAAAQSFYAREHADSTVQNNLLDLRESQLPIGWSTTPDGLNEWGLALLGWLLTAAGTSLGASFWFDLLGRALQLRGSGARVSATTGEPTEPQRPKRDNPQVIVLPAPTTANEQVKGMASL